MPASQPPPLPLPRAAGRSHLWSVVIFILLVSGVGIQAYRDLSRPEAWTYWKELYFAPSMTASLFLAVDLGGKKRAALAVRGTVGEASASWFRERIDGVHLVAGDVILLSSPGGRLDQAVIMGEIIRSRGLVTAVGVVDSAGRISPSYCASACVIAYAGGETRFGIEGSKLGVHRFSTTTQMDDPVGDSQRITGTLLGYMKRMGVSSTVVEAMSETRDIRWLGAKETSAMSLVTDPVGRP
jgi:hypothetical protein